MEEEPSGEALLLLEEEKWKVCILCDKLTDGDRCRFCNGTHLRPSFYLDFVDEEEVENSIRTQL